MILSRDVTVMDFAANVDLRVGLDLKDKSLARIIKNNFTILTFAMLARKFAGNAHKYPLEDPTDLSPGSKGLEKLRNDAISWFI